MIERLQFPIDISAEQTIIWEALWKESSYREWVSVFFEGSYALTDDWKEGSKVHFLAPDQSGIYSVIEKHIPDSVMQFRHIGMVKGGKEQEPDDGTKKWSGTMETYTLTKGSNAVTLKVEIDVLNEHLEFMKSKFPQALQKIKENAENNSESANR